MKTPVRTNAGENIVGWQLCLGLVLGMVSTVSSYWLPEMVHNYIGCICMTFLHCESVGGPHLPHIIGMVTTLPWLASATACAHNITTAVLTMTNFVQVLKI